MKEVYKVTIEEDAIFQSYDNKGGLPCLRESWKLAGKLHRSDGPALIYRDAATGFVYSEEFFRDGKRHRDGDKPSLIEVDPTTGRIHRLWSKNGMGHRDGGPAETYTDRHTGVVRTEWWKAFGQIHRDDGPAHISRTDSGRVYLEEFYRAGRRHREGGPSTIWHDDKTGQLHVLDWRRAGKSHRTDGPAYLEYHRETGELLYEKFYIDGRERARLPKPRKSAEPA